MSTDDELADAVRAALGGRDPVPAHVVAAAMASLAWRDLESRLAELVADSAAELTAVRGTGPRLLTFEAAGQVVEIETEETGGRLRIVGQLVPPAAAQVVIQQPAGERRVDADELGRFAVDGLAPGPTRVVCGRVRTAWTIL